MRAVATDVAGVRGGAPRAGQSLGQSFFCVWQVTFCKSLSGRYGETLFVTDQSLFTVISSMAAVMFLSEACCQGGQPSHWPTRACLLSLVQWQQHVTCLVDVTCHLQAAGASSAECHR